MADSSRSLWRARKRYRTRAWCTFHTAARMWAWGAAPMGRERGVWSPAEEERPEEYVGALVLYTDIGEGGMFESRSKTAAWRLMGLGGYLLFVCGHSEHMLQSLRSIMSTAVRSQEQGGGSSRVGVASVPKPNIFQDISLTKFHGVVIGIPSHKHQSGGGYKILKSIPTYIRSLSRRWTRYIILLHSRT